VSVGGSPRFTRQGQAAKALAGQQRERNPVALEIIARGAIEIGVLSRHGSGGLLSGQEMEEQKPE